MSVLQNIRIVLVGTQEPMNVGAAARAMKNFGLSDLVLVAPEPRVLADLALHGQEKSNAYRLAVHADDILQSMRIHAQLSEAVVDCVGVVGTTVRVRDIYSGQVHNPRTLTEPVLQASQRGPVAVVFGRETHGLNNDELDLANWILRIPTSPAQPSLNLAQAVLLLSYELFMGATNPPLPLREQPASSQALEGFFADLEAYILQIGFSDANRFGFARRRLRKIFHKAQLSGPETQLLRGVLHQSRWYARYGKKDGG